MSIKIRMDGNSGGLKNYRRLLAEHLHLVLENKERILSNPYLGTCNPGLPFGFVYAGPQDVRLGSLLKLWEQPMLIGGEKAYLLSCGALLSNNHSSWYLSESKTLESGYLDLVKYTGKTYLSLIGGALDKRFQKDLYVDFPRLVQELQDPENYAYSQRLEWVWNNFREGFTAQQGALAAEHLKRVRLYFVEGENFYLDVYLEDLYTPPRSLGLINYKAIQYQEMMEALFRELEETTGYRFVKETGKHDYLLFRQEFTLYLNDQLISPDHLASLSRLFQLYEEGMKGIHRHLEKEDK